MGRTMSTHLVIAFCCVFFMGYPLFAEPAPVLKDKVAIIGTSNVRNWSCKGDAIVETEPGRSAMLVPGLSTGIERASVVVSVKDIQCSEGQKMDEHMRKALKFAELPEIRYQMNGYVFDGKDGGVSIDGEMTIAGVKKLAVLKGTVKPLAGGGVRIVGQTAIRMTDFDVKPPALMLGMLKVANEITITFGATLHASKN